MVLPNTRFRTQRKWVLLLDLDGGTAVSPGSDAWDGGDAVGVNATGGDYDGGNATTS